MSLTWPAPPTQWSDLAPGCAHVWSANLEQPAEVVQQLESLLSPDERERAAKFRFEVHQQRYVVGRGVLRLLLGGYLRENPSALTFHYSEKGKPTLSHPSSSDPFSFNLAHSGPLLLVAFARSLEIGVDVEQVRPMQDLHGIADRFFSKLESATLKHVPAEDQPRAFFQCWTRKEAVLKATGDGIGGGLDQFAVSLQLGQSAMLLENNLTGPGASCWQFTHLEPDPNSVGALAAPVPLHRVDCWQWSPVVG